MSADPSEQDLLQQASHGQSAAVAALFARHRERLRRAIELRLGRRVAARLDASDVLQETYLEVVRRLPEYLQQPDLPFALWLT
jgi:RNA polymerase sigma-70 factor (ECF subfamily)